MYKYSVLLKNILHPVRLALKSSSIFKGGPSELSNFGVYDSLDRRSSAQSASWCNVAGSVI